MVNLKIKTVSNIEMIDLWCHYFYFCKDNQFGWGVDIFCFTVEVPNNCLMNCQYLLLVVVPRELIAMTSNTLSSPLAPPTSQISHAYSVTSCSTRTYFIWDIILCHWVVSTCHLHWLGLGMSSEVGTGNPIRCSPFLCHPGKKYWPLHWKHGLQAPVCGK